MPHGSAEPRRVSVVTGAAGFLGSHLWRLIAARGDELRVLVRPGDDLSALDGLRLTAVHGDVRSAEDLDRLFAGLSPGSPDSPVSPGSSGASAHPRITVHHLASRITTESRVAPEVRDVNVGGTRQVIDACRRHGAARSPSSDPGGRSASVPALWPLLDQLDPARVDLLPPLGVPQHHRGRDLPARGRVAIGRIPRGGRLDLLQRPTGLLVQ